MNRVKSVLSTKKGEYYIKNGNTNYMFSTEDRESFEEFLLKYMGKYNYIFELSKGYINLENRKYLVKELLQIKEEDGFEMLELKVQKALNDISEIEELGQAKILENNIDLYFRTGETWYFPAGVHGLMEAKGMRKLINFPYNGEELYRHLESKKNYYQILAEYGVYPELNFEEILKYEKFWLYPDWEIVVNKNEHVLENRMESLFSMDVNRAMAEEKYDDKFYVYFSYKKYTPSATVIEQVKEYAQKFVSPEFISNLEIVFWPTTYEGFKKQRELFDDENGRYAFTGEEIHITFD
ncbi:MAG: hypothetical protein ACK5LT_12995 [Lachnospirales bacterium]